VTEDHADIKEIVRSAYDAQAARYGDHVRLQGGNLDHLLARLAAAAGSRPRGRWLDVGCGTGLLSHRLRQGGFAAPERDITYVGVDLSPGMIAAARRDAPPGATFEVADAEALPFSSASFDVVLSNSALHWLNDPERGHTPDAALAEMIRLLRPGGWLALSVAGTGTARRFQRAYHAVMAELASEGVALGRVRRDPVGSMGLDEVVAPCLAAGLDVVSATLRFEPVRYADPEGYAADVAAYGQGVYLAPVPEDRREGVWDRIAAAFRAAEGAGTYLHDQYMIYLVARR